MPASGAVSASSQHAVVSLGNAADSYEENRRVPSRTSGGANLNPTADLSRPASSRSSLLHIISNESPLTDPGSAVDHIRQQPVRPHTTPQAAVTWSLHQIRPVDRGRWPGSGAHAHPLPPTNRLMYVLTLGMVILLIVLVFAIGVIIVTLPVSYEEEYEVPLNFTAMRNGSRVDTRGYHGPGV